MLYAPMLFFVVLLAALGADRAEADLGPAIVDAIA